MHDVTTPNRNTKPEQAIVDEIKRCNRNIALALNDETRCHWLERLRLAKRRQAKALELRRADRDAEAIDRWLAENDPEYSKVGADR